MRLSSPAFNYGDPIPKTYTCDGQNINPPLIIEAVPQGTISLALIMDDPDAPMGTWVHWVLYNINRETKEIVEDSVPIGAIEATTSFGKPAYGGPCPPDREHRYFFKLYALDADLVGDKIANKQDLEKAMEGHILEMGELMGVYDLE
ncbi:MAG: YbhB/YbcL family Raf kinase inhibitor-like protein, partial [Candidatus Doudnabacteria bacterium]|nr:YbhB/YbcL family Raf kinase inhibitor-like protein [Candidatus Doudnabacteria bacterium]